MEEMAIVSRDLADAQAGGISSDWRFGIAHNAALKLYTISRCSADLTCLAVRQTDFKLAI